ncbi:DedA family protein [Glutamicibacter soli]|uniref:DedA family protein n=1 Tax=Glutamicibacter soli TaxID=453836 RepID=A0A365YJP0_9MICC|nr:MULTISPECIES: DedA family protein [Micrococcaceae]ALD63153.1 alkaline phosphatase [Arthrobacter sp. LS16]ALQ31629.1 alkaline phosphatase [Arthrobacter sp. YC-RL1]KLI89901.1 alkaline phosphatase [Arthrobacter sp. YC-RL1]NAZ15485.1 DedA family protein [Glutamicibacter soli]RBM02916.1 DedA family protein [Glutamicibacter soli]
MELVNEAIMHAATAWWILPLLFAFCLIDGVFPVVPSETFLVSLAAVGISTGSPNLLLIFVIGVSGAIIGDQITFRIGRSIGYRQYGWMQKGRAKKILDFATRKLETSGALLIFTARYIPLGRVAVNMTAGATGFSYHRFTFFDVIGCITWGAYSVGIGALAGNWLSENKLLGIGVSVVIAVVLGYVIDKIVSRVLERVHRRKLRQLAAKRGGTLGKAIQTVPPGEQPEI